MGATLVNGGADFQVWAPTAQAVHLAVAAPGTYGVLQDWVAGATNLLVAYGRGYHTGFIAATKEPRTASCSRAAR